ncbi:MAG: transporter related, partial [Armatimonadetes bacterium]|nr:transporter related [Armatimonadota bacterium]
MRGHRLLRYAARYRRGWAFIAVVTVLSSAFALVQPWPMKILVDHVLGKQPVPTALSAVLGVLPGAGTAAGIAAWVAAAGLLAFGINSTVDVLLTRSWVQVGQGMVYDLAGDLFSKALRRSQLFHQQNSVGELMVRVTSDSWCVHTMVD